MPDLISKLTLQENGLEEKLIGKIRTLIDRVASERVSVYVEDKVLVQYLSRKDIEKLSEKFNVKIFEDLSKLKFLINGQKVEVDQILQHLKYKTGNFCRAKDSKPETLVQLREIFAIAKAKFGVEIVKIDQWNFEIKGPSIQEAK